MSLLSVGEIRRFKFDNPVNPKKSLVGVVVEVDELYNSYAIVEISGGYYTVPFGSVLGTVKVSTEQRRIMLELAKEYIQLKFIHDEKKRLTNKAYEVQGNIDTLVHKLKLQYNPKEVL